MLHYIPGGATAQPFTPHHNARVVDMYRGVVAAAVYLVDVRPAVKQVGGGGSRGTHMGPYGPW